MAGSHDREVSLVLESSTLVPLHHRLTLQYLLTHLAKVTQAQASNGLDTHTLGQIFGPLLIRRGPSTPWYARVDSHSVCTLVIEASLRFAKLSVRRLSLDEEFCGLVVETLLIERTKEQELTPPGA